MYVLRIKVQDKCLPDFPNNWTRVTSTVLAVMTPDAFLFDQLRRNKKVVHLTQLNLATGEILQYSSTH